MNYIKKILLSLIACTILFLSIGVCITCYGAYSICIMKIPFNGLEKINYILANFLGVITLGIFLIFSIPSTFLNLALSIGLKFIKSKRNVSTAMKPEVLKSRNKLIYINIISLLCIVFFGNSYYKECFTFYTYTMCLPCMFCLTLCACISHSIKLKFTGKNSKKFCCFLNIMISVVSVMGIGITIFLTIFLPFGGFNTVPKIWSRIYVCCILLSTLIISIALLSLTKLIRRNKISKSYSRILRTFSIIGYMLVIIKSFTLIRVFFLIEQHYKQFFLTFIIKSIPFTISVLICSLTLASLEILLKQNNNL